MHSPSSDTVDPAIHTHAAASELPVGDSELTGHVWHVASAVAPAVSEYLPASQSVHSALPVPALNLPAIQSTHAPPSGPVEPALHTHAVAVVLAAGEAELSGHAWHVASSVAPAVSEYLPASQSVHSSLPVPALNLPATHSTHAPPSGPVEPALQTHAIAAVLAVGEAELSGHASHEVEPEWLENEPAAHWMQSPPSE